MKKYKEVFVGGKNKSQMCLDIFENYVFQFKTWIICTSYCKLVIYFTISMLRQHLRFESAHNTGMEENKWHNNSKLICLEFISKKIVQNWIRPETFIWI